MKTISRLVAVADWSVTLFVSYLLLQFGADRVSRVVSSRYINGDYSEVDGWLSALGVAALLAIFCLVHPKTRFYSATLLAVVLGGDSLKSLSLGDPQALTVPLISLASATLVLLSGKPSKKAARRDSEEPSLVDVGWSENHV